MTKRSSNGQPKQHISKRQRTYEEIRNQGFAFNVIKKAFEQDDRLKPFLIVLELKLLHM